MEIRSVGIIGYGNFGAFVHVLLQRFAPKVRVRIHAPEKKPDGKTFSSLEEVAASDAVILAVPIHAFEEVVKKIVPHLSEDVVIVDVCTVKMHPIKVLKRLAKGRKYIATHPMFGPESYEKKGKDITGLRIVIAEHTLTPAMHKALVGFLRTIGFSVVEMNASTHDKHLAKTLFLTHFIGQTIAEAGFDRTEIDTVSFGFLMSAVESVRGDKKLFADVFRYNVYCTKTLERFKKAESRISKVLRDQS